jgi:Zn-dependent peptidase ImmA (M78 family)
MTFYPSTIRNIIAARGFTLEDVSKAAGMSLKKVQATLDGESIPTKNQLVNLASRLAVPPYAFFAPDYEVYPSPVVDFRAAKSEALKYGKDASKFEYLFRLRDFLDALTVRLDMKSTIDLATPDLDENPEQFAKSVEGLLNLSEIRKSAKNKAEFYNFFRKSVEDLGIYVVQDHNISINIDGFALYDDNNESKFIFVNTLKRNHGAKSFTLAHELSHIFGKRSAISNNYEYDNEVEAYSNEFAASLLIPREILIEELNKKNYFFNNYDMAKLSAEKLSDLFKCSISAMFVRLERLGYSKAEYTRSFLSGFGRPNFADSDKPPSFGPKDGPKPGVVDLAYFGSRAIKVFVAALERGLTTKYEIFENTGLSKKRIEGLIEVSSVRNLVKDFE